MNVLTQKLIRHARRVIRVRKRLFGLPDRPRMAVSRSLKHLYVQVIDDAKGHTLCAASTMSKEFQARVQYGGNKKAAVELGKMIAEKAKAAGVSSVCFDRRGYRFHGRIKALADAAREAGLKF